MCRLIFLDPETGLPRPPGGRAARYDADEFGHDLTVDARPPRATTPGPDHPHPFPDLGHARSAASRACAFARSSAMPEHRLDHRSGGRHV